MFELNGKQITEIDLGEMILGETYPIEFQYTGPGNVTKVAGCGCMAPKYDRTTKTVTGSFKANWQAEPNKNVFNKGLTIVMDVPTVLDVVPVLNDEIPSKIIVNTLEYNLNSQGKYVRNNIAIRVKGTIVEGVE